MVGSRQIAPGTVVQPIHKKPVIDGIAMLVEKNKDPRGIRYLGHFIELHIARIETVGKFARITHHRVHGHAADSLTIDGWLAVRRAFVDFSGATGIRS